MLLLVLFGVAAVPIGAVSLTAILRRTGHTPAAVAFMGAFNGLTAMSGVVLLLSAVFGLSSSVIPWSLFLLALACVPLSGLALWVAFKPWPLDRSAPGEAR